MTARGGWPKLEVAAWEATRDTLHMWTQVVGKVRLAKAPMVNHWWQVPLYVTPRGLSTGKVPHGAGAFQMEFDLHRDELVVVTDRGRQQAVPLVARTVAEFYRETMATLEALDIAVSIWPQPVEVQPAIPFDDDTVHDSYDPEAARLFWRQLLQVDRVLRRFRGRFIGKVSPVHLFWGALDLACTRFSGRPAPRHPGGVPNCGDWVMVEAYSHEVSSAGFWPGGSAEGTFYAYAYPEPDGFADHPVEPGPAFYEEQSGEFLLPYEAVRTAADPDGALLSFLQTTYEAAADHGDWDRDRLEDDPARRARPR